jgi:hypothetical protein
MYPRKNTSSPTPAPTTSQATVSATGRIGRPENHASSGAKGDGREEHKAKTHRKARCHPAQRPFHSRDQENTGDTRESIGNSLPQFRRRTPRAISDTEKKQHARTRNHEQPAEESDLHTLAPASKRKSVATEALSRDEQYR